MPPTRPTRRVTTRADFVDGTAGALFRTCSWPADVAPDLDAPPTILFVAPIGEEMNRSRRFMTALRHACAERGARAVLVDPFGTGDSAGEFVEASWEIWLDDLVATVEDSIAATAPSTLLGIRSGCLLVDALVPRLDIAPATVVQIQPELDGAAVVRRFLSTRVLAERFAGRKGESVATLEARIAANEPLELGGYEVGAALLRALGERRVDPSTPASATTRSLRFDLTDGEAAPSTDPSRHALPTRPFWQLAESVPDSAVIARIAEAIVP